VLTGINEATQLGQFSTIQLAPLDGDIDRHANAAIVMVKAVIQNVENAGVLSSLVDRALPAQTKLLEQLLKSHTQSISEGFQGKADVLTLADGVAAGASTTTAAAIDVEVISVGRFVNSPRDEVLGN
jgi:hypothetical protein